MSHPRVTEPPVVPECELEALIGEGGVGQVWRGRFRGQPVAVKVFARPDRPSLRRRFVREGRLLQRLRHPGLVRCLHVVEADAPALVLELLRGMALDRRVARAPLTGVEATVLARSLLDVLGFLHGHGIVHRDVKSGNVWLADDGRVVLMDLGLAVTASDAETGVIGEVLGTYAYMPPEQLAGGEIDHRADLYSLGVTLYEAVAGVRPYTARGAARWLVAHRAGGARPLAEIVPGTPVELSVLVDRLMARDPAHRPGSALTALTLLNGTSLGLASGSAALIGRAGAVGAVHAVIDGGGVLRVSGDVGSGVGAVLHAARSIAEDAGRRVLSVRVRPNTRPADLAASIARELGRRAEPSCAGVRDALVALAEQVPVLLVVEDLDAGGPEIGHWLEELAAVPQVALIVGGFRLGEVPAGRSFLLRSLDDEEVYELTTAMLGSAAVPPGLDLRLGSLTGRMPGLIVPALRDMVARGAVWSEEGGDSPTPAWHWDATVRSVGAREVAQLFDRAFAGIGPGARALMRAIAVGAGPLPLAVALAVTEATEEDARALADEGLVEIDRRHGEDWVSVRQGYLELAVRSSLGPGAEQEIHARIAAELASRARPVPWERVAQALHFAAATGDVAASRQVVEFADQLARAGRADTAMETLDRLGAAPVADVDLHVASAVVRAEGLLALGRISDAEAVLQAAEALGPEVPDPARAERVLLLRAELEIQSGRALVGLGDRVLAAVGTSGGARPATLLGELALRAGELGEAEVWFNRGRAGRSGVPGDRVAWRARAGAAEVALLRGDAERACSMLVELAHDLRSSPLTRERASTLGTLARTRGRRGQLAEALRLVSEAVEVARLTSSPFVRAEVMLVRAELDCVLGQGEVAAQRLGRLSPYGSALVPFSLRAAYHRTLAEVRAVRRERADLLAVHVSAAELAAAGDDRLMEAFHSGVAAILSVDDTTLARCVDALESAGAAPLLARVLLELGRYSRDSTAWPLAESAARRADEQMLLLEILHQGQGEGAKEEAAAIVARALDGLGGPPRRAFCARREVAWALDGPRG